MEKRFLFQQIRYVGCQRFEQVQRTLMVLWKLFFTNSTGPNTKPVALLCQMLQVLHHGFILLRIRLIREQNGKIPHQVWDDSWVIPVVGVGQRSNIGKRRVLFSLNVVAQHMHIVHQNCKGFTLLCIAIAMKTDVQALVCLFAPSILIRNFIIAKPIYIKVKPLTNSGTAC